MGCDIHTAVEFTQNGTVWELAGERAIYKYQDRGGRKQLEISNRHIYPPAGLVFPLDEWEKNWRKDEPDHRRPIWCGRNYNLFAALAGVRNYHQIVPMADPRGWPDDLSSPLRDGWPKGAGGKESERRPWANDPDLHTPSYFTLEEMLLFDYSRACGTAARLLKKPVWDEDRAFKHFTTKRKYSVTYREYMGDRYFEDVEVLRRWADGKGIDPSWVRVVFAFDN